jgi:hypothetical protein
MEPKLSPGSNESQENRGAGFSGRKAAFAFAWATHRLTSEDFPDPAGAEIKISEAPEAAPACRLASKRVRSMKPVRRGGALSLVFNS